MASKEKKNEVKHSKNVMQKSRLSAERDLNIGDSNYFIQLSVNHWFLMGTLGIALLLLVSQTDFFNSTHSREPIAPTKTDTLSEKKQDPTKALPPQEEEKEKTKMATTAKPKVLGPLEVINTLTIDAPPSSRATANLLRGYWKPNHIPCVAKLKEGECRQELYCQLQIEKDTVEVGMSTQVQVVFYVEASLRKLPEKTILATNAMSSDPIYIPLGKREAGPLKEWLEEVAKPLLASVLPPQN